MSWATAPAKASISITRCRPVPAGIPGAPRWIRPARKSKRYGADIIVVSLGVDTFKDDPISQFKLDSPDYLAMGARIARLGKPTLFVMEGGYAVEEIGINAVNVLEGFEGSNPMNMLKSLALCAAVLSSAVHAKKVPCRAHNWFKLHHPQGAGRLQGSEPFREFKLVYRHLRHQ